MTDTEQLLNELKENGRKQYDQMQANLTRVASSTDAELIHQIEDEAEMFGERLDPEDRRDEARKLQDLLDKQGRDAYAEEYAKAQILNY